MMVHMHIPFIFSEVVICIWEQVEYTQLNIILDGLLFSKSCLFLAWTMRLWLHNLSFILLDIDKHQDNARASECESNDSSVGSIFDDDRSNEIMLHDNCCFDKSDPSLHQLDIGVIQENLPDDETSSSASSACESSGTVVTASESPMGVAACSLQCRRIRVFPNKPGIVLPEGASLLPFSDDKWIAVVLDV